MERITVKKPELLAKLQQNRADHRAIFEEALAGWMAEAERELTEQRERLLAGVRRDVYVRKPVPTDHTSDYDRAVAMIEMSIGETIVLSEEDFAQYVMDDWGWQSQFLSNTYGSTRAVSKFSASYTVS
jgi:hypothetical protein